MIAYQDVSHAYDHTHSVQDVTLRVEPGETAAIVGPSGCGKSTLLKLAVGLLSASAGRIVIARDELNSASAPALRRRIGYVVQSGGLFSHLTAEENVTLAARRFGFPIDWRAARLQELGQLVQLPRELLQRRPGELSGGQRQRVSLMRALMLDPEVLLLDEPLGALDPMVRFDLQVELRALFDRLKKSVLLVTHDLAEAAFFSERLVLMRAGKIVQQGPLQALAESPADEFVHAFVRAQRGLHLPERSPSAHAH